MGSLIAVEVLPGSLDPTLEVMGSPPDSNPYVRSELFCAFCGPGINERVVAVALLTDEKLTKPPRAIAHSIDVFDRCEQILQEESREGCTAGHIGFLNLRKMSTRYQRRFVMSMRQTSYGSRNQAALPRVRLLA